MKKVSVRSFCLLLTLVLLTTFLPAYAEEAHEPLSLYCSASWNMSPFLSAFHEAYPEVQLNVINLATSNMSNFFTESLLQGECIPDIYTTTILPDREAQQRYLLDLSGEDFTNNYTDAALREVDNSGKVYLLPSAANLLGIYYNKTLIERLGLALPNSFEDLLAMKEALPDEAIDEAMVRFYKDQYGIDLDPEEKIELLRARMDLDGYIWNFFFNLGATDFFSTPDGVQWKEDFLAGRATAVGTLEPVADLLQKYIDAGFIDAKDIGNNRSNPTFMLGGCLFHMALQWTAYHWESPDYGTWDFGFLPYLADENGDNVVITQTARYYGLNKDLANNPQKLEDAKKFLAFLSTPEARPLGPAIPPCTTPQSSAVNSAMTAPSTKCLTCWRKAMLSLPPTTAGNL